jgi:hypothetical protein
MSTTFCGLLPTSSTNSCPESHPTSVIARAIARFANTRNPAVTRRTCSGGETRLSVGSGRLGTCLAQSGRAQSPSGWSRSL